MKNNLRKLTVSTLLSGLIVFSTVNYIGSANALVGKKRYQKGKIAEAFENYPFAIAAVTVLVSAGLVSGAVFGGMEIKKRFYDKNTQARALSQVSANPETQRKMTDIKKETQNVSPLVSNDDVDIKSVADDSGKASESAISEAHSKYTAISGEHRKLSDIHNQKKPEVHHPKKETVKVATIDQGGTKVKTKIERNEWQKESDKEVGLPKENPDDLKEVYKACEGKKTELAAGTANDSIKEVDSTMFDPGFLREALLEVINETENNSG